jgi:hypothetical protein
MALTHALQDGSVGFETDGFCVPVAGCGAGFGTVTVVGSTLATDGAGAGVDGGGVADQRAGVNVCVAIGTFALSAASMFSVPTVPSAIRAALPTRIAFTWSGVRSLFAWSRSAAAPAT